MAAAIVADVAATSAMVSVAMISAAAAATAVIVSAAAGIASAVAAASAVAVAIAIGGGGGGFGGGGGGGSRGMPPQVVGEGTGVVKFFNGQKGLASSFATMVAKMCSFTSAPSSRPA